MKRSAFRQYDIRGRVGEEFSLDQSYTLGRAIGAYLVEQHGVKRVVVGMDGRTHSPQIKDDLIRALRDSGLDVQFIGICTSPILYFALDSQKFDAGIMVTASHNTKEYNGLKLRLTDRPIWGDEIAALYEWCQQGRQVEADKPGTLEERDYTSDYIEWLVGQFGDLRGMKLPVIIDCGNGTTGPVTTVLVERMAWQNVTLLYADVDGTYPNHEADPTVEANMREVKTQLSQSDAVVGIGFDGDGDRMAAMTASGYLVPGDEMLALFAQQVNQNNPGASVVCDVRGSMTVSELLDRWGMRCHLVPAGSAYVLAGMKKYGALLGGEVSGHFMFADQGARGFDDGIYAALRLLEILHDSGKMLEELRAIIPTHCQSPELRIACAEEQKEEIVSRAKEFFSGRDDAQLLLIDGVRVVLPHGCAVLRASNTQPAISVRFESATADGFICMRDELAALLAPYVDISSLQSAGGAC